MKTKVFCTACAGYGKRPEERRDREGRTIIVRERCRACKGSRRVVQYFDKDSKKG